VPAIPAKPVRLQQTVVARLAAIQHIDAVDIAIVEHEEVVPSSSICSMASSGFMA